MSPFPKAASRPERDARKAIAELHDQELDRFHRVMALLYQWTQDGTLSKEQVEQIGEAYRGKEESTPTQAP